MIRFTDRKLRVAIIFSGTVHLLGLSAFAAWSAMAVSRSEFAGERLVIQITAMEPVRAPEPPQVKFFPPTSEVIPPQPPQLVLAPKKTSLSQSETVQRMATVEQLNSVDKSTEISERRQVIRKVNQVDQDLVVRLPKAQPANISLEAKAEIPVEKSSQTERPPLVQQKPSTAGISEKIAPDLSKNNPPPYPSVAFQQGWEGTVMLRVSIDERGVVTNAVIETSSGFEILDQSAVNSVRRWTGKPAYQKGKPIATVELLPVRFKLR